MEKRDDGLRNPLSIVAVEAAYEKGYDWLMELRLYLDDNFKFVKDYLSENLARAKFSIPDATYFAWIDISSYFFNDDVYLPLFFANKAGVLLEGGNMFVANSDGYVRLNLACPKSLLEEGLNRICRALNNRV